MKNFSFEKVITWGVGLSLVVSLILTRGSSPIFNPLTLIIFITFVLMRRARTRWGRGFGVLVLVIEVLLCLWAWGLTKAFHGD